MLSAIAALLLATGVYSSPVTYDITLAGNFGEPRPYHFHGGLDIKTANVEGKLVLSIGDGYVSRITVGKYGFGNAVYVSHPEGYTSVYCHLKRFNHQIERRLHRTGHDTLDVRFPPSAYPVSQGEPVAISGNTGHSTGPHLHLEIHNTRTWMLYDPLEFIGHLVADTVAPRAHSFMACPVAGEGVFEGSGAKQTFGFGQSEEPVQHSELHLGRVFTAWGRVGFALWADDYAQGVYNHYGIRHIQLLVDGREVFRSDVNGIPISCQLEVNEWGDYDHWRHTRVWYMKSFVSDAAMRLPILHTNFERGIITIDEERPYHLTYILRDYQNNTARYSFTVQGRRDPALRFRSRRYMLNTYLLYGQCLWPLCSLKR